MRLPWICDRSYTAQNDLRQHFQIISEDMNVPIILPLYVLSFILRSIAFFKEFEQVRKFFKRATKSWKMLCDHALQTNMQSRLRLLHVDNFKSYLLYKTAKSLDNQRVLKSAI